MYRPYWYDRVTAGLDGGYAGRLEPPLRRLFRYRAVGPLFNNGVDPDTTEGAIDLRLCPAKHAG